MAKALSNLTVYVTTNLQGLRTGFQQARKDLDGFKSTLKTTGITTGFLAITAAAAAVSAAFVALARKFDDLQDQAQTVGMTAEQLHGLSYAASLSGVSADAFTTSIGKMLELLDSAREGGAEATNTLARLGLTLEEFEGLNNEQAFLKIADALSKVDDQAKKVALTKDIFGKGGMKMLPLIDQGSAGIQQTVQQGKDTGAVLDNGQIASLAAASDAIDATWEAITGKIAGIFSTFAPQVVAAMDMISEAMGEINVDAETQRLVFDLITGALGGVLYTVNRIRAGWNVLQLAVEGVLWGIVKVVETLAYAMSFIPGLSDAGEEARQNLSLMADALKEEMGKDVDDLKNSVNGMVGAWDNASRAVENAEQKIREATNDKAPLISDEATRKTQENAKKIADAIKGVQNYLESLKDSDETFDMSESQKRWRKLSEEVMKLPAERRADAFNQGAVHLRSLDQKEAARETEKKTQHDQSRQQDLWDRAVAKLNDINGNTFKYQGELDDFAKSNPTKQQYDAFKQFLEQTVRLEREKKDREETREKQDRAADNVRGMIGSTDPLTDYNAQVADLMTALPRLTGEEITQALGAIQANLAESIEGNLNAPGGGEMGSVEDYKKRLEIERGNKADEYAKATMGNTREIADLLKNQKPEAEPIARFY